MKKYNRYIYIVMVSASAFGFFSCKKFIDLPPPGTQVERRSVFENDQAAISAITGLYSTMTQSNLEFANAGITLHTALSSDELNYSGPLATTKVFETNSLISDDNFGLQIRLWTAMYKNIFRANSILEGLLNASVTDSLGKQLRGEALVVRALNYFYLVNLFGDVPLLLSTDYNVNSIAPRTAVDKVYEQVVNDMMEAKQLLRSFYVSPNRARPNKWVASALLSRIYLYQKNWKAAEAESEEVINSGVYGIVSNLADVFQPSSNETIWQLPRDNNNTADGITFIPSSATTKPSFTISPALLGSFETGDLRKQMWLGKNTISGQDYYYPYKYRIRTSTPISEYNIVLRFAEQFLICAEAKTNLDKISGTNSAASCINIIRNRAGLGNTSAAGKNEMLAAIERERQTELFVEWGHRWLDLKRTNRADAVLAMIKAPNWQPTDALYPIPAYEMQTNPFLVQNPGY